MRQFASPYLYLGNGANPLNGVDVDGLTLGKNAEALDKKMKEYDYFGSELLKSDFFNL